MSKIEKNYLIIGNGRVAIHLSYYFSNEGMNIYKWKRKDGCDALKNLIQVCDTVLLAISDGAIQSFIDKNSNILKNKTVIHFSGALNVKGAVGCHPLMTFTPSLYTKELYRKILFCIDDTDDFKSIFPKLKNPYIVMPKSKKAYYHALCVMANNFTCLLWQKFYKEMNEQFGAGKDALEPFLKQTVNNISFDYKTCLTGPLARNDEKTIEKNINSLDGDSFQQIYQSFVKMYQEVGLELQ